MKISRFSLFAVAAVALFGVSQATAGVTTSYIQSLGSHLEHFNDASFETTSVDNGTVGILDVGDVLTGVFKIDSYGVAGGTIGTNRRITPGGGQPEVTGVFSARVASKVFTGTDYRFTFAPDAAFEATYGTGAMAAMFEDPANNFVGNASVAASTASANGGLLLAVIGFTGAGGTAIAGEGWRATTLVDDLSLAATFGATSFGDYQANLNLVNPADFAALNITKTQISTFGAPPLQVSQFSVNGQLFGDTTDAAGSWNLSDSADIFFRVNAIPEPASVIAWSVLGLAFIGARMVRSARKIA